MKKKLENYNSTKYKKTFKLIMENIYFKKTFSILTQMRVNDNRVFFYNSKPLKAKKI
jgi:hypothetical protein